MKGDRGKEKRQKLCSDNGTPAEKRAYFKTDTRRKRHQSVERYSEEENRGQLRRGWGKYDGQGRKQLHE